MLELRPICEHCNKALQLNSLEARICSFECTFYATCVDTVLQNTCPNCGGGFAHSPIRPTNKWVRNNYLGVAPASTHFIHKPVNTQQQADLLVVQNGFLPQERYGTVYQNF